MMSNLLYLLRAAASSSPNITIARRRQDRCVRRPGLRESSWREPFASVARGAGLALRGERPGVRRAEDDPLRELPFRADILRVDSYGHPCGPRCFACAATNRQSWHQPRLSRRVTGLMAR